MKRKSVVRCLSALFLLLCLICCAPSAFLPAQAASSGSESTVKKGWVKEKAGWCYYSKGKKLVSCLKKISGKTYYFGSDGARKTGWYTVKVKGKYKTYKFDSKGAWTGESKSVSATLVKKLDSVIASQKIDTSLSDQSSKKAALKKLFQYAVKNWKYGRAPLGFNSRNGWKPAGWEYTYAKEMLSSKRGSCFHDAAAFALLARRATGLPVRICLGTSKVYGKWSAHGWVEIQIGKTWYTYDTNGERFSSKRKGKCYQQKASSVNGKIYKAEKRITAVI